MSRLARDGASVITADSFTRRYRELMAEADVPRDNPGSVECVGCRGCQGCTFCRDSERLTRCHYCVRCMGCVDATHCASSRGLLACQHCIECESCLRSSYLVRCVGLSDCTYAFGCVGLAGCDFHILNEPYERAAYFELTARLRRDLAIAASR